MTIITLAELANLLGAQLEGDGERLISGVNTLVKSGPGDLSFFHNEKYAHELAVTHAGAVLVSSKHPPIAEGCAALISANPYLAMAKAVNVLCPPRVHKPGIHPLAFVDETAQVATSASVAPFACIMAGAKVGENSVLLPFSYVGFEALVGKECLLHPSSIVLDGCTLGDRVILNAGAVLGSDGFGFAPGPNGYTKFPQVGSVEIGNDVELGANVTIDRGALGDTEVAEGVKLDNMVHLAHNVKVGKHTIMAAQTGISGSTEIGEWCIFGGQVGVVGHLHIANRVLFGAQSGVTKNGEEGKTYFGYPAREIHEEKRILAYLTRLEELFKRVKELEKQVEDLGKDK